MTSSEKKTLTKEETKTFLELLAEVPEHRKGNAIKYSLRDVLFLAVFAILCGAETYTGMAVFSELHKERIPRTSKARIIVTCTLCTGSIRTLYG